MAINFAKIAKKQKKFESFSERDLLILFCGLLVFLVGWLFPIRSVADSLFAALILLFAFPILIVKSILKEPLRNFGFTWGKEKIGLILSGVVIIIFTPLNYLLLFKFQLKNLLVASPGVSSNFWMFLGYELVVATLTVFALEFFFRGFIQLGLEKKLGSYSLFLGTILGTVIFMKNSWLVILIRLLMNLSAGIIAQKSRSIAYPAIAIWLISVMADIMIIKSIIP